MKQDRTPTCIPSSRQFCNVCSSNSSSSAVTTRRGGMLLKERKRLPPAWLELTLVARPLTDIVAIACAWRKR